jgi:hypothetical protein
MQYEVFKLFVVIMLTSPVCIWVLAEMWDLEDHNGPFSSWEHRVALQTSLEFCQQTESHKQYRSDANSTSWNKLSETPDITVNTPWFYSFCMVLTRSLLSRKKKMQVFKNELLRMYLEIKRHELGNGVNYITNNVVLFVLRLLWR